MAPLTFRRRYLSSLTLFAALFFILGAAPSDSAADRIRHVIDGDTVVLQGGEHVRLIGVNAPEYNPWRNHVQPYGKEAKEYLTRLLEG